MAHYVKVPFSDAPFLRSPGASFELTRRGEGSEQRTVAREAYSVAKGVDSNLGVHADSDILEVRASVTSL